MSELAELQRIFRFGVFGVLTRIRDRISRTIVSKYFNLDECERKSSNYVSVSFDLRWLMLSASAACSPFRLSDFFCNAIKSNSTIYFADHEPFTYRGKSRWTKWAFHSSFRSKFNWPSNLDIFWTVVTSLSELWIDCSMKNYSVHLNRFRREKGPLCSGKIRDFIKTARKFKL